MPSPAVSHSPRSSQMAVCGNFNSPLDHHCHTIAATCLTHCRSVYSLCEPAGLPTHTAWHRRNTRKDLVDPTCQLIALYTTSHKNSRKWVLVWMNAENIVGKFPKLRMGAVCARLEQFARKRLWRLSHEFNYSAIFCLYWEGICTVSTSQLENNPLTFSNFACSSSVMRVISFVPRNQTIWKFRLNDSKFRVDKFKVYWFLKRSNVRLFQLYSE